MISIDPNYVDVTFDYESGENTVVDWDVNK